MSGFNSPNILFLNTYDSTDRKYVRELAPKLGLAGYDRYAELLCGAFTMPLVMVDAGWEPEQMHCYDVSLFSNILGYVFSGKDLGGLGVCKDEEPVPLSGDPIVDAGTLLYEQALARMRKAESILYYRAIVEDMKERRDAHVAFLAKRVGRMDAKLHGLSFETLDLWDAFELEKGGSRTFVCSNPPTYKGAYEKFFDTDGAITWNAVPYELWDGARDCPRLLEVAKDQPCLLLYLQQADKDQGCDARVSARYLSVAQNVYYNSNKPGVVESLVGRKVETAKNPKMEKSAYPVLPFDYAVGPKSNIRVFVEETKVAEYYRQLWLHRITGKAVSVNLCVLIDGMAAGFIGLDFNALVKPYRTGEGERKSVILSYAVPAPNGEQRLARLLVAIAKSRKILDRALANSGYSVYLAAADSLCTVEYSRFDEVKGLRGLMKRESKKTVNGVHQLVYVSELDEKTLKQVKAEWLSKEVAYRKRADVE